MADVPALPPESVANPTANTIGYAVGAVAFFCANGMGATPLAAGFAALVTTLLVIAVFDLTWLKVHTRSGVRTSTGTRIDLAELATKLVGLCVALAAVYALSLWLIPMAGGGPERVLAIYPTALLLVIGCAPLYFYLVDRVVGSERDGLWEAGMLALGKWRGRNWHALRHFALGWLIKAYYFPLMLSGFWAVSARLSRTTINQPNDVVEIFAFLFLILLFVDLMVAVIGYTMTFKLLDTHIRSTNPVPWGWVVTVGCYAPFWGYVAPILFDYSDGVNWNDWFAGQPLGLFFAGAAILFFRAAWVWANCSFGLRFSNLTHRGILTSGAFRLTKHPSYIAKNIGWWLVSLPFLSLGGIRTAIASSLALLTLNLVYFLRSKAEERHLSEDPAYVEYALWINEHGVLAPLGRLVPWLRYRN